MTIDRLSGADLMPLTTENGPVPSNIGAVLTLSGGGAFPDIHTLLADRVARVPRLRKRIGSAPFGCGRPFWVDDPSFRIDNHVVVASGRWTGDSLLRAAEALLVTRLPKDRPLWGAMWVPEMAGGASALVLIVHHVLADGIGGIAVLGALCDEVPDEPPDPGFPRPAPGWRELWREAWTSRALWLRRTLGSGRDRFAGLRELGVTTHAPRLAPRTSINRPSGPRRRVTTTQVALAEVVRAAHAAGGTVNDVVLTATAGALAAVLRQRGEDPGGLVVSVPISARRETTADELGNAVGALPILVPTGGNSEERLQAVMTETAGGRSGNPGSSSGVVTGMARALGSVGMAQWFVDRQRLVNTFETNVRGPSVALHLAGRRIDRVVPMVSTPGNATVTFGVMSYAGEVVVAVYADPDVLPEQDLLTDLVAAELAALT